MSWRVLSLVLVLANLPGCAEPKRELHFLVLEFTATSLTDDWQSSDLWGHCWGAWNERTDAIQVSPELAKDGGAEKLILAPTLVGNWSSYGEGSVARSLPAGLYLSYGDELAQENAWGHVDGEFEDSEWTVRLNGDVIDLPHAWNVTTPNSRIDALVSDGPDRYDLLPPESECD